MHYNGRRIGEIGTEHYECAVVSARSRAPKDKHRYSSANLSMRSVSASDRRCSIAARPS